MKTRILSATIMLPLLIVVFVGDYVLMAACLLIGIMGVKEFFDGFKTIGIKPSLGTAFASAGMLYGIYFGIVSAGHSIEDSQIYLMLWLFASVLVSLLCLFKIEERKLEDAMVTITGIFYVIFFSFHVTLVEQAGEYGLLVWLIFLTAFGTDIMAYFTGVFLGKHKLCPKISPKKTIEGSIGGILGSVIFCGIFGYILMPNILLHCIIIGVFGGVISQFGDLTASIFKRKIGIKDYGKLIPGHGGILDRFDSVLFTAPMVYYYIMLVLK